MQWRQNKAQLPKPLTRVDGLFIQEVPNMKILVLSAYKNPYVATVLRDLRAAGHSTSFVQQLASDEFRTSIEDVMSVCNDPYEVMTAKHEMTAIRNCDVCVLVTPASSSSFVQFGYSAACGKPTVILIMEPQKPERMFGLASARCLSIQSLIETLPQFAPKECKICASW